MTNLTVDLGASQIVRITAQEIISKDLRRSEAKYLIASTFINNFEKFDCLADAFHNMVMAEVLALECIVPAQAVEKTRYRVEFANGERITIKAVDKESALEYAHNNFFHYVVDIWCD